MKLAIVGPGSMGCLFAALLTEGGHDVVLVDYKPERAELLSEQGIIIEDAGEECSPACEGGSDRRGVSEEGPGRGARRAWRAGKLSGAGGLRLTIRVHLEGPAAIGAFGHHRQWVSDAARLFCYEGQERRACVVKGRCGDGALRACEIDCA